MSADPSHNGGLTHAPVPVARPARDLEQPRKLVLALPLPRGSLAVAGGMTVSAVLVACVRLLRRRRRAKVGRRGRKELRRSVVGTRSFLVDVHLLGR